MSEQELAEQCKRRNAKAERMTFDRYSAMLRGVCYRYVNSVEETEDLLQDSFIKIFDSIESFTWRGDGSFSAWMRRIVVNTAINALNKKKRLRLVSIDDEDGLSNRMKSSNDEDDSLLESLSNSGVSPQQLLQLLNGLPEMYKIVFNLAVIDGLKHKEIASMIGIDESSSRSRLLRAKTMLRESLTTILQRNTTAV